MKFSKKTKTKKKKKEKNQQKTNKTLPLRGFPRSFMLKLTDCPNMTVDHTCDISLFRRDLPIFEQISLFEISKFPYISYTSPYFKFQISLFEIKNFLLCLIILPISKSKSPYLASQVYHMYAGDMKCNHN